jgi:hypothetical protein
MGLAQDRRPDRHAFLINLGLFSHFSPFARRRPACRRAAILNPRILLARFPPVNDAD